ncbi:MAG: adenylosuccinate lyase [Immundisolibacterales bacterium]|nr:adenylosuccinate lyase [Immundisolibacterales bacterium]
MTTSHITDSRLFGTTFGSAQIASVFSDRNRVQKWFDIEAALALTQGELGIIPSAAAQEIARKADATLVDLDAIGREISSTTHPLVPAIRALADLCEGDAGEYVHYGATTQDVMDTGMVLMVREAWPILLGDLHAVREKLAATARAHRDTLMVGRTHGQQALPVTFGYKLAVWVDEIDRHLERCTEAEPRIFVGNITGAVGTMASFGPHGIEMQRRALARLGLGTPRICWHSARDRVAETAWLLVQVAGTFGKMANEVYNLQRTEIDEVHEPFHMGKVGSSTMPHKRNPASAELAVALWRLIRGLVVPLTDALFQEHERDASALRVELAAVPELAVYCGALFARMRAVVENLEPLAERMRGNANRLGGLLLSERVMLALGGKVGKQTAHEIVYEVAMAAQTKGTDFRAELAADHRVAAHLDREAVSDLLDPEGYLGLAGRFVDEVAGH